MAIVIGPTRRADVIQPYSENGFIINIANQTLSSNRLTTTSITTAPGLIQSVPRSRTTDCNYNQIDRDKCCATSEYDWRTVTVQLVFEKISHGRPTVERPITTACKPESSTSISSIRMTPRGRHKCRTTLSECRCLPPKTHRHLSGEIRSSLLLSRDVLVKGAGQESINILITIQLINSGK